MKKVLLANLSLLMVGLVQADVVRTDQYAYGYDIRMEGSGPVSSISINQTIYQGVYHPDLRDMTIINQDGNVIPFSLRREQKDTQQSQQQLSLPFYPLYLDAAAQMKQIQVKTEDDGTIINININSVQGEGNNSQLYYILDASSIEAGDLIQMQLEWQHPDTTQLIETTLQGSDDLQHWSPVASPVFSHMSFAGYELNKDTASLPAGKRFKYYRLRWTAEKKTIEAVHVLLQRRHEVAVPSESMTLDADATSDTLYHYDALGYFPVSSINIVPGEDNTIAEVRVYSRNNDTEEWRLRGSATVYRLRMNERLMQNDPIAIPGQPARYWQVEVTSKQNYFHRPPQLFIQWQPQQVLFLAQGQGPYRLLFGRSDQNEISGDELVHQLINVEQRQGSITTASLANYSEYCGTACLTPPPKVVDWTRYVLWLVILAGVAGLVRMSLVLWREMNSKA